MLRLIGLIVVVLFGTGAFMGYQACNQNPDPIAATAALSSSSDWPVVGSVIYAGGRLSIAFACQG